ncbi:hypothetical protein BJY00DRAFT_44914 [Aspergillus carlsbadensis]|nr:hypothetical protein BJY00DRAFT_44914 [Aspergillus carlsbadensis]
MSVALGFAPRLLPARLAVKANFHRQSYGHATIRVQTRTSTNRSIATNTSETVVESSLACTWLTPTPEQITPDDILSSCPNPSSSHTRDYARVLLVTPAFARWTEAKSPFLEQWMNKFNNCNMQSSVGEHVYAVIAVVDRLPGGDKATAESEGLSMLFVRGDNIQGKPIASRQIRSAEREEPTIKFSFQEGVASQEAICPHFHEVGLRLANTIFINGKENTLFGTRWAYDPSAGKLGLKESVDLSLCSVTVNRRSFQKSLELPLYPVGERRKVITSMGNILRQIGKHADGESDEPMPASSELEKELPRYIDEHNIADRRVSVWALIETSAESPYSKAMHSRSDLAKSIQAGAKLHRVMSGGGGWGKKQGLLSLDPEISFEKTGIEGIVALSSVFSDNAQRATHEVIPAFEQRMFMEDLSTLSQAAEPGDYVQFFASIEEDEPPKTQNTHPPVSEGSISYNFGVVSDAETLPSQTEQQRGLTVIPNHFGALSEKAITYLQPVDDVHKSRTKIDVPGSRLVLTFS